MTSRISLPACALGAMIVGAAGARAQPPEPGDDWSGHLFDLLPAIDACIAASSEPAVVLEAWPVDDATVGMRLLDVLDQRWDCVAPVSGVPAVRLAPAPEEAAPAETTGPVFTRAPGAPPPAAPCYEHEEVLDPAGGEVVGWLSYPVC
jgi:hypothetical protein